MAKAKILMDKIPTGAKPAQKTSGPRNIMGITFRLKEIETDPLPPWVGAACTRCGKCCLDEQYMLTLSATEQDVKRWRREHRNDILQYVDEVLPGGYDLWVKDGEELSRCPFVKKDKGKSTYHCMIYETRPEACRGYPVSTAQMVKVGCEIVIEVEPLAASIKTAR